MFYFDKQKVKDFLTNIRKLGNKSEKGDKPPFIKFIILLGCLLLVITVIVVVGKEPENLSVAGKEETIDPLVASNSNTVPFSTKESENEEKKIKEEIDAVVTGYSNLGIVQVEGYLNVRKAPGTSEDIIGKLYGDGACEILEDNGEGWYKISSGGFEGYISSEFVLTGEEAVEKAKELVELRAIITADELNVRKEPDKSSDSVGQALQNERYIVKNQVEGWIEINSGYISADFVTVEYALNEARKLEAREMVINLYNDMGISNVSNYLNVRDKPSEDGQIIAKMPSKSAGDIVEKLDGWYKIKSGPITGYVKSEYILTGSEAKDAAMRAAELMVVVNADGLNVRTKPTTESSIWTQLSNSEKYRVISQLDGWAEIEMDTTTGFVSTDYVEVRYALDEAIKYTPQEEKSTTSSGGGGTSSAGKNQSLRAQIANYAAQFLGNPYVWGGTSLTNGADCSGFTMKVYSKFGVSLPHHSGSQASKGKSVSSANMRPGDLLFYSDSSGTINHVAMYIGNGQIVHAANKKSGIKLSSWNYRSPVKIVNVLGD